MKNKLLIALTLVMVLSLTFAFVACNSDATVTSIKLVDGSFKTDYVEGSPVDFGSAKLKVTYSDGTDKEVALTKDMLDKEIDTSKAGEITYTITYKDATTTVTIKVVALKEYAIDTFQLPTYITNALEIAAQEGAEDFNFKVTNRIYEVGNANAFLVKCVATATNLEDEEVTLNSVKTTYKVKVSDTEKGTYTELTGDALKNFVTVEDGYKYFFSENAADKFVELTISLDANEYDIESGVTASRTINFKVVDNGYNVYDQDGLSVMNDNTRPELWADIWGCTVDANGNLQATDNVLTLDADKNALYTYVGNIDWVVLHGNITINADKLPADFFWSKDSTAKGFDDKTLTIGEAYSTAKAAQNAHPDQIGNEKLEGTLIDGDGYGVYYSIAKNNGDSNNNKGLYNTTKVSVSGNYNAIIVDKTRSESGRLLKVLVNKDTGTDTKNYMQMSQWYLFKMFNPRAAKLDEEGNITFEWKEPLDDITFELKNVALTGNGGKTESVGPQGICMVNTYATEATINNVVANSFYTNVAMDNHYTDSTKTQKVIITDTKMYDTYNAMALTWRGAIDIKNSMLKNAGGPLVLIMDGNSRDENPTATKPVVTVDKDTELEALAMGNESWYSQLGSLVPQMFGTLQTLDAALSQISGKTFCTTQEGSKDNYLNVVSIMIPEAGTALYMKNGKDENDNPVYKNHYRFTGSLVLNQDEIYSMEDPVFSTIVDGFKNIYDNYQQKVGTAIIKSGSAYAVVWQDNSAKHEQILISPEMLAKYTEIDATTYWTVLGMLANNQMPTAESPALLIEYYQLLDNMCTAWRTQSSDQLMIWTQADVGNPTSPYLGLVLGSYHAVDAK